MPRGDGTGPPGGGGPGTGRGMGGRDMGGGGGRGGWEVPDLVLVPAVSVYVHPVELLYLIK